MPVYIDFSLNAGDDAVVQVVMAPNIAISGWALQHQVTHRFGTPTLSGLITKSAASGFNNVSGINVTDGINGVFNVGINGVDTSGWQAGIYAYQNQRLDSGFRRVLTEGYLMVLP